MGRLQHLWPSVALSTNYFVQRLIWTHHNGTCTTNAAAKDHRKYKMWLMRRRFAAVSPSSNPSRSKGSEHQWVSNGGTKKDQACVITGMTANEMDVKEPLTSSQEVEEHHKSWSWRKREGLVCYLAFIASFTCVKSVSTFIECRIFLHKSDYEGEIDVETLELVDMEREVWHGLLFGCNTIRHAVLRIKFTCVQDERSRTLIYRSMRGARYPRRSPIRP